MTVLWWYCSCSDPLRVVWSHILELVLCRMAGPCGHMTIIDREAFEPSGDIDMKRQELDQTATELVTDTKGILAAD